MNERYCVTVSRVGFEFAPGVSVELAVVGPFRTREAADRRAGVIRRLAEQYEDPEGVTGPDNNIDVVVEPILSGREPADYVMEHLYG